MNSAPSTSGSQNTRSRSRTLEEIILEILRAAAKKAGNELADVVVSHRIAEAEDLVARHEAKAIIAKAINYAKGIATDKKFQAHHLLKELGIKIPSIPDGGGNTVGKPGRKARPAQSAIAQPGAVNTSPEKPKQGVAGEGAP